MAKKRKSSPKVPKRSRRRKPQQRQPMLGDRRALERELAGLAGSFTDRDRQAGPLQLAQEMMYEAFDADDPRTRIRLASAALEASPDCADAYVVMAEYADTPQEALALYEQGVAAGRRALGEHAFIDDVGHFWGILETRPYMRAREGLAECLWALRRRDEAVTHYQEMLRLNPNDNQGIRYRLCACLLEMGRDDAIQELFDAYPDEGSSEFAYARALAAFRRDGDTPRARNLLDEAMQANKHVPVYLLGKKPLPQTLPDYVVRRSESEAVALSAAFQGAWKATPGALTWLRGLAELPSARGRKPRSKQTDRLAALARLPQTAGEVWQADATRTAGEVQLLDERSQPYLLIVTSPTKDALLFAEPADKRPSPTALFNALLQCIEHPDDGEPHRPEVVQVCKKSFLQGWRPKLDVLGIRCERLERLEHLDAVVEHCTEQLAAPSGSTANATDPAELPQAADEVWQADVRRTPLWVHSEGGPRRPYSVMVTDRTHDLLVSQELIFETDPNALLKRVLHAMHRPAAGPPRRPAIVEVRSVDECTALRRRLDPVGVACVVREQLDHCDSVFDNMIHYMTRDEPVPALVDAPGLLPDLVGDYFAAAADFYRSRPWQHVPGDRVMRIEFPDSGRAPWHAVVMGQSGMTLGLAVYEDLAGLHAILSRPGSDAANARRTTGFSVTFGEPFEMPGRDLAAAEQHDWPIAAPEAYPQLMRLVRGKPSGAPSRQDLHHLTATLRAIPQFPTANRDSAPLTVPTATGDCKLLLSWQDE